MKPGDTKIGPGARVDVSARHRLQARAAIQDYNAVRHLRPKCGARRRTDGEPCQDVAMANGKCYRHGGRVPKGKAWHVPKWPDRSSPDAEEKLALKLATLEKRRRKKAERLARRSPEERAAHAEWQKTHKPGSPEARAAAREDRRQAREARARLEAGDVGKPRPPELQVLDAEIAALKRSMADRQALIERQPAGDADELGAFG